jgi:hypothetical protein
MKKAILIAFVFCLAGNLFTSCKSHEKCPAYSKANTVNTKYKKSV